MRESELERKFRMLVTQAGGRAYKFISPGSSGVPDRLVVLPGGRIGFVELKRRGEALRKQQLLRHAELRRLGCYIAVVDSAECAQAVVHELLAQTPQTHAPDPLFSELVNRIPGRKGVIV